LRRKGESRQWCRWADGQKAGWEGFLPRAKGVRGGEGLISRGLSREFKRGEAKGSGKKWRSSEGSQGVWEAITYGGRCVSENTDYRLAISKLRPDNG